MELALYPKTSRKWCISIGRSAFVPTDHKALIPETFLTQFRELVLGFPATHVTSSFTTASEVFLWLGEEFCLLATYCTAIPLMKVLERAALSTTLRGNLLLGERLTQRSTLIKNPDARLRVKAVLDISVVNVMLCASSGLEPSLAWITSHHTHSSGCRWLGGPSVHVADGSSKQSIMLSIQ